MDHNSRMIVPDQSGFAAVRHGATWYALRRLSSRSDLRNGFGLLSLKVKRNDGWHDLVEPRPVPGSGTSSAGASIGPVIVREGRRFHPVGLRIRPRDPGAMTIVTNFRSAGRKSFTLPVTYRPSGGGLNIGVQVPRGGDRVEITSFHPTAELSLYEDGVTDAEARISVTGLAGTARRDGFVSCCEAELTAITLLAAPSASRRVTYRIAAGPLPVAQPG